ncbi:hypothetical protein CS536_11530 [Yersinia kristensenii]|nr:hypothetical protein CS536_11530 [Yersinia kristensenii]
MGLAAARPLQAAFKAAPSRFVTRITDLIQLIGIMSLYEAHPMGQRKRCSTWFTTKLSFTCCLAVTPMTLGIYG